MDQTKRALIMGSSLLGALFLGSMLPVSCGMRKTGGNSALDDHRPPKRPEGKPKPLIEEDITPVLARLDKWYAAHLPQDQYIFNPPASEAELDAFESLTGITLPKAYRQLYRWHNGDAEEWAGHLFGTAIATLEYAASNWKTWNEVLADFDGNRYEIPGGAWPEGAVDPAYINPRWISLTYNGTGNHLGLDFDPWPAGRVGQIIIFGRDEDVKIVVAESLGTFLDLIATLLENGNFRLTADMDSLRFGLKDPPADDLLDGMRTLVGAPGPFL